MDQLTRRASRQDRIGRFFLYLFVAYAVVVLGFLTYKEWESGYRSQQRLEEALHDVQEQHLLMEKYIKCALLIPHPQRTEAAINACTKGDLRLTNTDMAGKDTTQSVQPAQPIAPVPSQPIPESRSSASNKETSDRPDRQESPSQPYSGLQMLKNLIKGVKDGLQIHN